MYACSAIPRVCYPQAVLQFVAVYKENLWKKVSTPCIFFKFSGDQKSPTPLQTAVSSQAKLACAWVLLHQLITRQFSLQSSLSYSHYIWNWESFSDLWFWKGEVWLWVPHTQPRALEGSREKPGWVHSSDSVWGPYTVHVVISINTITQKLLCRSERNRLSQRGWS